MANTFDYIKVTDKNLQSKDAVFDAAVVANYGDPGLDEDYHADILSKYVICKLESSNRTLSFDRYKNMLVVVKRPESLWINYQGGFINNPANQQRVDASLNTNVGIASNYSSNNIPRINSPYKLGEKIKIKLIKNEPYYFTTESNAFFSSACNVWNSSSAAIGYYQGWHNQGLNSNPYIVNNNGANNLEIKTITQNALNPYFYSIVLNKIQYEAFLLNSFPQKAASLVSLFNGSSSFSYYYNANGGYAYSKNFFLPLNFVKYEDLNIGEKARTQTTNCIPLIVSTPNTFTVPKSRNSGTVNYTPTYIQKS